MASSSSSRRKWKVAWISRNANPTGLIGFTMIKDDDHQQVYPISESLSANKIDSTKTEEDEWARWLCGENRLYVRIAQKDTWDSSKLKANIVIVKRLYGLKNYRSKWKGR
ncbi:hypothetical protein LR48_Vigan04g130000 [Vigna angularis]|uniref:Uncharacterized protein n=1 Tax=Phaseolus angularis TaxID=3914 RepID=A0A0L9UEX4_PHAAN|nr:hypothetical protein LR48_Vigan04g130000 [Vigna angularis]